MKKRILTLALTLCLLAGVAGSLGGCSLGAPKIEQIYDRVVELVEGANALNTVFYGAGFPVYEEDSTYAEFSHLYYNVGETAGYEVVTPYAAFTSVEAIKAAAEQIFSNEYLETVLYPAAFDGYAIDDSVGGSAFAYARYLEANDWIYRSKTDTNYLRSGMRVYDYSTMKIVAPSNGKACFVSIESWLPETPEVISTDPIRLVLQDDGEWYLDSFTG